MKILVIAPHPDDETLGCGGTLFKHKDQGDQLFWLIMTKMTAEVGYTEMRTRAREEEIKMVADMYNFEKIFPLDFATTTLDTVPRRELVSAMSEVVNEVKPEIVYLPNRFDIHSDHRVVFEAVMGVIKTFRMPFVKRALSYEILSETEFSYPFQADAFVPNSFSDISNYLNKKIEAMRIYKGEFGARPFPRSEENMRALATLRGSTIGVEYAEGFNMLKEIW